MDSRQAKLDELNATVSGLLDLYRSLPDPDLPVYEHWSAKDVLAHLTFWHESFARNVDDLAHGRKPNPLRGRLADLNLAGVEAMKPLGLDQVLARFEAAHAVIRANILAPGLPCLPYRKGSRDYTPEEHLEIVDDHISMHLQDVCRVLDRLSLPDSNRSIG
jgi:hypothetical protein